MPHLGKLRAITTNASNFPFSEGILKFEFPKMFMILNLIATPVRVIQSSASASIRTKMVSLSRNDSILCQIFPFILKGIASDWFYSLLPLSIHNIGDLTKLFLAQYSSHQKFNQKNHRLLSVKMRPSDSLKA